MQAVKQPDMEKTDAKLLAGLIKLTAEVSVNWGGEDMGAILRHQLRAPLRAWLKDPKGEVAEALGVKQTPGGTIMPSNTLADLLRDPKPSAAVLDALKRSAKKLLRDPDSPLPRDVAMAIYVATIALARTRCGKSITKMDDKQLVIDIRSVLRKQWMDPSIESVLRECLATMSPAVRGA